MYVLSDTLEASKLKHPVDSVRTKYDMNKKHLSIICTMLPRDVFVQFFPSDTCFEYNRNPYLRQVNKYVNQASGGTPLREVLSYTICLLLGDIFLVTLKVKPPQGPCSLDPFYDN